MRVAPGVGLVLVMMFIAPGSGCVHRGRDGRRRSPRGGRPRDRLPCGTGSRSGREALEEIPLCARLALVAYDPLGHVTGFLSLIGYRHPAAFHHWLVRSQGIGVTKDDTAYLVFRGTSSKVDWVVDLLLFPWFLPLRHFGFGLSWRSLKQPVETWLDSLPENITRLVICGHSLGGAMAHVAALELAEKRPIARVVSFGAPKAFFARGVKRYEASPASGAGAGRSLGDVTHCVVNLRDIVARVPPSFLGYRELGRLVFIDLAGDIHLGERAKRAREETHLSDRGLLGFLFVEERTGLFGVPGSTAATVTGGAVRQPPVAAPDGTTTRLRQGLDFVNRSFPVLIHLILLPLLYLLLVFHLLRSAWAHMGELYTNAFESDLCAIYRKPEKSRFQVILGFIQRMLFVPALLFLLLWGLWRLSAWWFSHIG